MDENNLISFNKCLFIYHKNYNMILLLFVCFFFFYNLDIMLKKVYF